MHHNENDACQNCWLLEERIFYHAPKTENYTFQQRFFHTFIKLQTLVTDEKTSFTAEFFWLCLSLYHRNVDSTFKILQQNTVNVSSVGIIS